MNIYDSRSSGGTLVRMKAQFGTDPNNIPGTLSDPGAVTCGVRKPDGSITTPATVKDSTGTYHADIDIAGGLGGFWRYTFTGTSPLEVTQDGVFQVVALGF